MAKVYDPIMCMMVERGTTDAAKAYSVGYKSNGVFQSIGVMANSENEAVEKAKRYFASKGRAVEVYGASIGESLETMKMKGKPVLDKAIKLADTWNDVYKKFESIVDKYFPDTGKINAEVRKLYEPHRGERDWDEAYKRWRGN
jgi:hypothetical protein